MKRSSLYTLALFAVVALVFVQGCKSAPPVDVTGKWAEIDGPDSVEFKPDGSFAGVFIYDSTGSAKAVSGTFATSVDKVTLTSTNDPPASMVWKATLANGVLAVTYTKGGTYKLDGSSAKFHRAN